MIHMKPFAVLSFVLASLTLFIGADMPKYLHVTSTNGYVGSKTCLVCHQNQIGTIPPMIGWKNTFHAASMTKAFGDSSLSFLYGIRADVNNNGIDDFKENLDLATQPAWVSYGVNAPKLSYLNEKYYATVGELRYEVVLKQGVYFRQNFKAKVPIGGNASGVTTRALYTLPMTYIIATREWKPFDQTLWYNGTTPRFSNSTTFADVANFTRTFDKSCAGCHVTGVGLDTTAQSELVASAVSGSALDSTISFDLNGDGTVDEVAIGCEACHGPGGPPSHANYGLPGRGIQNPNLLPSNDRKVELCGQCHSRGSGAATFLGRTLSYPRTDTAFYQPGRVLSQYFSYTTNSQFYWLSQGNPPNPTIGLSLRNRQQLFDYTGTFTGSPTRHFQQGVSCWSCHDPHNRIRRGQLKASIEDNALCLQCHNAATYQNLSHTHHVIDPVNTGRSRCVSCHMAQIQLNAIPFDKTEHSFRVQRPERTVALATVVNSAGGVQGFPNSCAASCHRAIENSASPIFGTGTDTSITNWGELADVRLADSLKRYYGPNGIWWNTTTGVERDPNVIASTYQLSQNYPNPFNPETRIVFTLARRERATLKVYNLAGQEVATVVEGTYDSGTYTATFDGSGLSSGVYFYTLSADGLRQTKKMLLIR